MVVKSLQAGKRPVQEPAAEQTNLMVAESRRLFMPPGKTMHRNHATSKRQFTCTGAQRTLGQVVRSRIKARLPMERPSHLPKVGSELRHSRSASRTSVHQPWHFDDLHCGVFRIPQIMNGALALYCLI
jgi:hypothetical protein